MKIHLTMEGQAKKPLLSICIPIYNRLVFLERMLERFVEDKSLFKEDIELIISDNCSEEDLESCIRKYQNAGLSITYFRQSANLGPDKNFETLFGMAKGKYFWLLGSDDIPVKGFLPKLLEVLRDTDYGLLHVKSYGNLLDGRCTVYDDQNAFVEKVGYWITFQSANVFRTEIISNVPVSDYEGTNLIQVPVFLTSAFSFSKNAVLEYACYEKESDEANNGGYNFFKVFVNNLFVIYGEFVRKGLLNARSLKKIKKNEYQEFIIPFIFKLYFSKSNKNLKVKNGKTILLKYYWNCPYAYWYLVKEFFGRIIRHL